jgi:hypothetical protein
MASAGFHGGTLIMKQSIRPFVTLLALSAVLLLTACGTSSGTSSVHYGVYSGYGYPYYGRGGDNYYYDNRPNRPNRPDRPDRPDRPTTQPVQRPGGGMTRPGGGMGRPAGGMARGGGRGGGRGGRR